MHVVFEPTKWTPRAPKRSPRASKRIQDQLYKSDATEKTMISRKKTTRATSGLHPEHSMRQIAGKPKSVQDYTS